MLTSNEALDAFVVFFDNRSAFVSKGSVIELDSLLEQYGQGIRQAIGDDALKAGKFSGKLYTLPTSGISAAQYSLVYNKDIADKNGIDLSGVQTIDDLTAIFKQVKEKIPGMEVLEPQMVGMSALSGYSTFDYLDDYYGVLPNFGQDGINLVNYYESAEYAKAVKLMRSWNQAGYIMKGASTNKEATDDIMKAQKVFGRFGPDAPGEMENCTAKYGFNTAAAHIMPKLKGGLVVNQWGIAQNSKNPEAAMKFLNLLYTDSDVANMAAYGIEGTHYQKLADGTIDYAAGTDSTTTGYSNQSSWMLTYQPVTYVWKGSPAWSVKLDYFKDGLLSKGYGFTFDSSSVKTEITSLTNVINQYKLPLECGEVDPDTTLPKFIAKLKDAGIEKVIAEKQKQLNEYAAANGVK
ncbi:MAG: ABC transporter substrate-binding protein [Clostridiales bacterium]|nr:ABC transporter substrate-binding protein [Clostridiales bacterium]